MFQIELNTLKSMEGALNKWILPAVIGLTPHRSPPNIEVPQSPSLIAIFVILAPNGGSPCDGNNAPIKPSFNLNLYVVYLEIKNRILPGVLKTFVVFLRFFHLARRFWNQTCNCTSRPYQYFMSSDKYSQNKTKIRLRQVQTISRSFMQSLYMGESLMV